jgi:hypothetical protein
MRASGTVRELPSVVTCPTTRFASEAASRPLLVAARPELLPLAARLGGAGAGRRRRHRLDPREAALLAQPGLDPKTGGGRRLAAPVPRRCALPRHRYGETDPRAARNQRNSASQRVRAIHGSCGAHADRTVTPAVSGGPAPASGPGQAPAGAPYRDQHDSPGRDGSAPSPPGPFARLPFSRPVGERSRR